MKTPKKLPKAPMRDVVEMLCQMIDRKSDVWSMTDVRGNRTVAGYRNIFRIELSLLPRTLHKARDHKLIAISKQDWKSTDYGISDEGRAYAEAHRHILTISEDKKRFLVTKTSSNYIDEYSIIGSLCEIISETPKRFNVVVVKHNARNEYHFHSAGNIQGTGSNLYVDKTDVLFVDFDPARYDALCACGKEAVENAERLADQEEAELEPIRNRYQERRKQAAMAFKDMLQEAAGQQLPPEPIDKPE